MRRNRDGYRAAQRFRAKLTHVAPVWFQVRPASQKKVARPASHALPHQPLSPRRAAQRFLITGAHDVDRAWVADMQSAEAGRAPVRVVPRYIIELSPEGIAELAGARLACPTTTARRSPAGSG